MNESEFNRRVDDLLVEIEEALDACGADIDYETVGGILTLTFDDDSKVIVNRQTPMRQVWVAARSGGFHFNYDTARDAWISDRDGENLFDAMGRYCSQQAGRELVLRSV